MSFQGDVAGIGLGELLQGLCRGGRDGVLTLDGDKGVSCFLGLAGAQISFLPGPTEDTDVWRHRCQRAWADFPDANFELQRRTGIAHAARRETLFEMLDSPNLHFRFEPGNLPSVTPSLIREDGLEADEEPQAEEQTNANPWGPTYSVEYLLLEHARISDEAGDTHAKNLSDHDMPRGLDSTGQSEEVVMFLEQCNGASTIEEIADRLAWPIRQVRGLIGQHLQAGFVRIADHRELMVAAQRELELGRVGRAAARLERWIEQVPPGPVFMEGEAELLLGEWKADRLNLVLNLMDPKLARGVLRRLDFVSTDREDALSRWKNLAECNHRDRIIAFKCAILSAQEESSEETEEIAVTLVKMGRSMQDLESPWRARALLRLAATQVHEKLSTRIELGTRLVQVGLPEEASPWILEAAKELLASGQAEKAIAPLRALSQTDIDQREASGLLIQARAHKTNLRRRRRNTLIGMMVILVLSAAALVRVKVQEEYDHKLDAVKELLAQPEAALSLMTQYFGDDDSTRVTAMRNKLQGQLEENRRIESEAWLAAYRQIEQEIEYGDPELGLTRALQLPPIPKNYKSGMERPERSELLGMLASRMELDCNELHIDVEATAEMLHEEQRLTVLLTSIRELADQNRKVEGVENFMFYIDELAADIQARQEERATKRSARATRMLEEQQDLMLAAARAHAQAGDLSRAVGMYDRLIELDSSKELRPLLAAEVEGVRRHERALNKALERAREGDHAGAKKELAGICPNLSEHIFPWRVDSVPSGARATFRGNTVRVTPFVLYTAFGEKLDISMTLDGCEDQSVSLSEPEDLEIFMHRTPERTWGTEHLVEAAPVPAGGDHIVFDRAGVIARLQADSTTRWTTKLDTLGGIARTPVFLPRKPGFLLVLSEDGQVWFVNAANGETEGPHDFGFPPVEGPLMTQSGISIRFADERIGLWSDSLTPKIYEDEGLFGSDDSAYAGTKTDDTSNLVLLRRSADSGMVHPSPWSDWKIEVTEEYFHVHDSGAVVSSFTIDRDGDWNFVAWEAPNALMPDGRVWVSDESGLRSFRPANGPESAGGK